ncbi:hypothetical protein CRUP_008493 [Coryphaenoides rupestris]|nr:hypothetical protein CRUP_008493 [Coryphaenoides rupestris]
MPAAGRDRVYLITGGCGFLGRHLLRVLLQEEERLAEVRLFDKQVDPRLEEHGTGETRGGAGGRGECGFDATSCHATPRQRECKVVPYGARGTSPITLRVNGRGARGATVVVSTPAKPRGPSGNKGPREAVINAVQSVAGTEHVIRACVELGIQYLVYTSSMEVVGPNVKGDPFIRGNEETPYNVYHTMPYPKSKARAEQLVLQANNTEHQLMKDFYDNGVRAGGRLIQGVPRDTEHGRAPATVGGEAYFCYDDSPYKSYEEFNMQFLAAFGFRQMRVPVAALWLLAVLNDLLRCLLAPVYQYTPLLNRYTLAVACTSFTVASDKARRHFRYTAAQRLGGVSRTRTQAWVDTFPAITAAAATTADSKKKDT